MVLQISNVSNGSYKTVIAALKKAKSDCSADELDKVSILVKRLIREKPDIKQLQTVYRTIQNQVTVITGTGKAKASSSHDAPNLSRLGKQVNAMLHDEYPETIAGLFQSNMKVFKKKISKVGEARIRYEIATLCAEKDPKKTAENIKLFNLKSYEPELYEVAKICQSPKAISLFREEGLKDEDMLLSLSLKMTEGDDKDAVKDTLIHLKDFGIKRETSLLTLAMRLASKKNPSLCLKNMQSFGIANQKDLLQVAKTCAVKDGRCTLAYISKLGIESPDDIFEIVKICAAESTGVIAVIHGLGIQEEWQRAEIVKILAKSNPSVAADLIGLFSFPTLKYREEILRAAVEDGLTINVRGLAKASMRDPTFAISLIESCILKGNFSSPAKIKEFKLKGEEEERLYDLAHTHNFLNTPLEKGKLEIFNKEFYPKMLDFLKTQPMIQKTSFSLENQKECCVVYYALKVLGMRIKADVDMQALKQIARCRNSSLAYSMVQTLFKIQQTAFREVYHKAVTIKNKVLDPLLLPMLYVSKWASTEDGLDVLELRDCINGGGLKKGFEGSGGSLEQTWLKTCRILDEVDDFSDEHKIKALLFVSNNFDLKNPKADVISRLNCIQSICGSGRFDLLGKVMAKAGREKRILATNRDENFIEVDKLKVKIKKDEKVKLEKDKKDLIDASIPEVKEVNKIFEKRLFTKEEAKEGRITKSDADKAIKFFDQREKDLKNVIQKKKSSSDILKKIDREIKECSKQVKKLERDSDTKIKALEEPLQKFITKELGLCISEILISDPYLALDDVENLSEKYSDTLGNMRVTGAWKIYQTGIEKTGDINVQEAFKVLIINILNKTYRKERYLSNSKHIAKILERHENIWKQWQGTGKNESPSKKEGSGSQKYKTVNTDDWQDLLLSGTEVADSCQNVAGLPIFTKCLMAYPMDGKNRMIAMKNSETGKIMVRSMFRLLWDETHARPTLLLELPYPVKCSDIQRTTIVEYAKKEALRLNCSLYAPADLFGGRSSDDQIVSLGSVAPFEYADCSKVGSGEGVTKGEYKVATPYLIQAEKEAPIR